MTECERDRRIATLKPGVDYRRGTRHPYRACPADFREVYLRLGSDRVIEEHYRVHWRAIARWIEEAGGDELRAARSAITGQPPRPYNRTRLPTYTEVLTSIMAAPSEGAPGNAA